jgi:hypothetical protein
MSPLARTLQITVVVQCLGAAWQLAWLGSSPIFSLLWHSPELGGLGLSEGFSLGVERAFAAALLVAALLVAWRPAVWSAGWSAGLLATLVLAMWWTVEGYQPSPDWLPRWAAAFFPLLTHAARVGCPLGLALLLAGDSQRALRVLRWAIAVTFAAHGLEAMQHNYEFVNMLIVAAQRLLGWRMPQAVAEASLTVIGVLDVVLALGCLTGRLRSVLWYMAVWGLATAAARIVVFPWDQGFAACATRLPHATIPLYLALEWEMRRNATTLAPSPAPTPPPPA